MPTYPSPVDALGPRGRQRGQGLGLHLRQGGSELAPDRVHIPKRRALESEPVHHAAALAAAASPASLLASPLAFRARSRGHVLAEQHFI